MPSQIRFSKNNFDTSVRPQDDFFQYSVGGWLKKNPIPDSESKWGTFFILRDDVLKRLHSIVKEITKKTRITNPETRMVRDFYASGMDMKTRNKRGNSPLTELRKQIQSLDSKDALRAFLFSQSKEGFDYLWGSFVGQHDKNAEEYVFHLTQGGLSLPDRDYYLKNDPQSIRIRKEFVIYVTKLLALSGVSKEAAKKRAESVLSFETRVARFSMSREDSQEIDKIYHKFSVSELQKMAPEIQWHTYLKTLGIDKKVRSVIVYQPVFITRIAKLIETVSLTTWKDYLEYSLINDTASYLSENYIDCTFSFYGTVLTGNKKIKPLWKRVLNTLNGSIGEALGKEYVKRYFTPETKKKANEMVDDLFNAYKARIENLSWMSSTTKKKALLKLSQMTRKIGYPNKWKSYKGLTIHPNLFYENICNAVSFERKKNLQKLGKKVDRNEWYMSPQTVNAYYSSNLNTIAFPAAILQPPFFDPKGDDAINYGAIGSVIGHEMTHGFDDSGAKFDGKGNYKNWWTEEDKKRFEKKTKVLVKQYNAFPVGNLFVNGTLTLGENIADLGGLLIAYDALQMRLKKIGERKINGYTPEQRFFFGLTLFEVAHTRPEFARMLVMVDPHSPAEYRVNGSFSNLESFYKAFDVKEGDKLFRKKKDRADIW